MKYKTSILHIISNDELSILVGKSKSIHDLFSNLGLRVGGARGQQWTLLKRRIADANIDCSHFLKSGGVKRKLMDDQIFIPNSKVSKSVVRDRMKHKIKYECNKCGLGEIWNNAKISLQIDHINGDHEDNQIENLRWLCPNCHSQTDTFAGKSKMKNSVSFRIKQQHIEQSARQKQLNHTARIEMVSNANIDFSQHGSMKLLATLMNATPQYVNRWLKKYMPEFYTTRIEPHK